MLYSEIAFDYLINFGQHLILWFMVEIEIDAKLHGLNLGENPIFESSSNVTTYYTGMCNDVVDHNNA